MTDENHLFAAAIDMCASRPTFIYTIMHIFSVGVMRETYLVDQMSISNVQ